MFVALLAQAIHTPPPAPGALGMLLPFLVLGTVFGTTLAVIAHRKGSNPFVWFFLGLIPMVGFFAALVLVSRPDLALLKRIWVLEDQLAKLNPASQAREIPPIPSPRA
jgi:hypothetical protein